MKLAASCIGWAEKDETRAYEILQRHGFAGLEVAPTMVAGPAPYANPHAGAVFARWLKLEHGLAVCSLQSIWYGQAGSMFGPERDALFEYTKGAIRFAEAAGAGNLVFGCPKNRVLPEGETGEAAVSFFKGLGDFAAGCGTVLALEANPAVYGTNFMNTTPDAFAMAARVNSPGCKVNLDVGTMLINGEGVNTLRGRVGDINHVHISEPQLAPIQPRGLHTQLATLLREEGYAGGVSIEMKQQPLEELERCCAYVKEVFA